MNYVEDKDLFGSIVWCIEGLEYDLLLIICENMNVVCSCTFTRRF